MSLLQGRVALVTGAGNGLGRAYALDLAARGARVVVNNRKRAGQPSSADAVAAEIAARGGKAVADYESVEDAGAGTRMVDRALDAFGRLDILVNNAGVSQHEAFHRLPAEDFERIFRINFFGTVDVTRAAFAPMRAAKYGRIVVSASTAGLYGLHGLTAYSAAKGALIAFAKALAQEGARQNIRVNAVAPYALTNMTRAALPAETERELAPELAAPLVAWLAGEACPVNGETIVAAARTFRRAEARESDGFVFPAGEAITPEALARHWPEIADMSGAKSFADALVCFDDLMKTARRRTDAAGG